MWEMEEVPVLSKLQGLDFWDEPRKGRGFGGGSCSRGIVEFLGIPGSGYFCTSLKSHIFYLLISLEFQGLDNSVFPEDPTFFITVISRL